MLSPFIFLGFLFRYGWTEAVNGLRERWGTEPESSKPKRPQDVSKGWLWFHAASVGEVRAIGPFLERVAKRVPRYSLALTTTTVSGRDLASRMGWADSVRLAPLDLTGCVRRHLDRWNVQGLYLVETELWPRWISIAREAHVPVVVLNGRISDRAFGWYRRLRFFWKPVLERVSFAGVQNSLYRDRFKELGLPADQIVVTGNLKRDEELRDPQKRPDLCETFGFALGDEVGVCGSTHEGEEELLLDVFQRWRKTTPSARLVLAPRHIHRVPLICRRLQNRRLSFRLRSQQNPVHGSGRAFGSDQASVLVLDTIGELPEIYGLARWAYVGGSLVNRGGQNPLEPARWGVPVLFGPHMQNFRDMADHLLAQGGAIQVKNSAELEEAVHRIRTEPGLARQIGQAARRLVESPTGSVEKTMALIEKSLEHLEMERVLLK